MAVAAYQITGYLPLRKISNSNIIKSVINLKFRYITIFYLQYEKITELIIKVIKEMCQYSEAINVTGLSRKLY